MGSPQPSEQEQGKLGANPENSTNENGRGAQSPAVDLWTAEGFDLVEFIAFLTWRAAEAEPGCMEAVLEDEQWMMGDGSILTADKLTNEIALRCMRSGLMVLVSTTRRLGQNLMHSEGAWLHGLQRPRDERKHWSLLQMLMVRSWMPIHLWKGCWSPRIFRAQGLLTTPCRWPACGQCLWGAEG